MITINYICEYCKKPFARTMYPCYIKKFKHHFCCQKHAAIYSGSEIRKMDRRKNTYGYIEIKMIGHPMARGGRWVPEHRLVMANKLGRMLTRQEQVHHINGVKTDNRIENLIILSAKEHTIKDRCRGCIVRKELTSAKQKIDAVKTLLQTKLDLDADEAYYFDKYAMTEEIGQHIWN